MHVSGADTQFTTVNWGVLVWKELFKLHILVMQLGFIRF